MCGTDAGIGEHVRGSRVECEECRDNWIPGLRVNWGTRADQSPLGSLHEDTAEIRRLQGELGRERRARGLEQLDMVRLESEIERLRGRVERLTKFTEAAAAAFHDLDYEPGYLHAKAALDG